MYTDLSFERMSQSIRNNIAVEEALATHSRAMALLILGTKHAKANTINVLTRHGATNTVLGACRIALLEVVDELRKLRPAHFTDGVRVVQLGLCDDGTGTRIQWLELQLELRRWLVEVVHAPGKATLSIVELLQRRSRCMCACHQVAMEGIVGVFPMCHR